jgi:ABC-type lipoprotein export system ATPase subunit
LRHVALRFAADGPALFEDLNWTLADPCWTALVGPSGSGKTSLIHLIAGLEQPSQGEVWVVGQNLVGLSDEALSRHRQTTVGTAFQHFHLQSDRSALDNLLLPLHFSGADMAAGRELARDYCQQLDLTDLLQAPVRQLSGGQRQRLALARALMNRPRLLLADEPIGNLDSESATRVVQLLARERARGLSLLVVTHDDFLLQGVDQVYRLEKGQLTS